MNSLRLCSVSLIGLTVAAGCGGEGGTAPAGPPNVASVTVTAPNPAVVLGKTLQLAIVVKDTKGAVVTDPKVQLSSSFPLVASVSATGVVTGLSLGVTTISATVEGVSGKLDITVLVPLQVGGSNYALYSAGAYLQNPTLDEYYTPGVLRHPIGRFDLDSETVKQQLAAMYANGQRKIAIPLWYADFSLDLRIRDSLNYGPDVNSRLGFLFPQHQANLRRVLELIRDDGYDELVFRFGALGISVPTSWTSWDEAAYQLNWSFITSIRDSIEQILAGSSVRVVYDLNIELGGLDLGQSHQYVRRLWQDYVAKYGNDRTMGFSFATAPGRLTQAVADFDASARERPAEYGFDIYGDELPTLTYVRAELAAANELTKPVTIQEDYYNDPQSASQIKQARQQLLLNIQSVFQWQLARGATQPNFSVDWPADYANYRTALFAVP